MATCIIPRCIEQVKAEGKMCHLCRGGLYYWKKKTPGQRVERRRKLAMYGGRIETFGDTAKAKDERK